MAFVIGKKTIVFAINKKLPPVALFLFAAIIYAAFAAWLFLPLRPPLEKSADLLKFLLFLLIPAVSALGVFILAERYVNSFVACFLAGIIYGFGPFASAFFYCFHLFHPFALCVYAVLPWTFIPAVFLYKLSKKDDKITNFLSAALSLLPFLFVFAAYWLAAKNFLFPIPTDIIVSSKSFAAIINPFAFSIDTVSIGFYHAPFGALVVGLVLFFKTRRFWTAVLLALAFFLAFYKPVLNVPPVFWLSFVVLICSLIIAEGFEALILAGRADANWLLLAAAALILQAGVIFALGKTTFFPLSAALSAIAVIAVLLVFFIARAGLAMHYLRMAVLYVSVLIDVLIITRDMINKILG
jgi:hypothetical protein